MPQKASGPAGRFARKKGKSAGFNPVAKLWSLVCSPRVQIKIKNEMTSKEISIWLLLVYFWGGSFCYTKVFEELSTLDSLYFLAVTVTTVGYGDIIPTSTASRVFTMAWTLLGVAMVVGALVEVAGMLLDARDALAARTKAALLQAANRSKPKAGEEPEEVDEEVAANLARMAAISAAKAAGGVAKPSWNLVTQLNQTFPVLVVLEYLTAYALAVGWLFSSLEGWTLIDGVYYAVVTGTSIGYGDVSPHTATGRTLACFYIPFAVVFTSTQLSEIPAKVFGGAAEDAKLEKLLKADLSLQALLEMDNDGDGTITEFEFLKFMLVSADMGDEDTLEALHGSFKAMDADGSGVLSAGDLPKVEPLGPIPASRVAPPVHLRKVVAARKAWERDGWDEALLPRAARAKNVVHVRAGLKARAEGKVAPGESRPARTAAATAATAATLPPLPASPGERAAAEATAQPGPARAAQVAAAVAAPASPTTSAATQALPSAQKPTVGAAAADTTPASGAAKTKPAAGAAHTKPAARAATTKPAAVAAITKPAAGAAKTKPAAGAPEKNHIAASGQITSMGMPLGSAI